MQRRSDFGDCGGCVGIGNYPSGADISFMHVSVFTPGVKSACPYPSSTNIADTAVLQGFIHVCPYPSSTNIYFIHMRVYTPIAKILYPHVYM